MPSGRLILVRHGETIANHRRVFADDDIPLSETGRRQSEHLAQRLARKFKPNFLESSQLIRAQQTSEIIGHVLGLTPEPISGLHERDLGSLKGLPYERFAAAPDSAETIDSVTRRAMAAIEALRDRYTADEIVVGSHGAILQSICAYIRRAERGLPAELRLVTIEYERKAGARPLSLATGFPLPGLDSAQVDGFASCDERRD